MSKIDAFGVVASLLLVWIFAVFLVPFKIMVLVYMGISAWWVGTSIGRLPNKLSKKTDGDYLDKMFKVADEQERILREMLLHAKELIVIIKSQQAMIDSLMFEYCPEDMTPEQIANYEAHVKAVSQQQEDSVNIALRH
jgi:hypothetical protein